jgi:CheY-like chemotaxis protein
MAPTFVRSKPLALPYYKRPGKVSFLDDDTDFLDSVGGVLPLDWSVAFYNQPKPLFASLAKEDALVVEEIKQHQEFAAKVHDGQSAILLFLAYWGGNGTRRYDSTRALVVDFAMPAMTGVEVLEKLGAWPGARLLLTGQADEMLAVDAFNKGLINQYIPKHANELARRLVQALTRQFDSSKDGLNELWGSLLNPEQQRLLEVAAVCESIVGIIKAKGWVEYVVIGAPFGVLGLDAKGAAGWIQLEHAESSRSLADLAEFAESLGLTDQDLQTIRSGAASIDLELQAALGTPSLATLVATTPIAGVDRASVTFFPIDAKFAPGPANSWSQCLAGQTRKISQG